LPLDLAPAAERILRAPLPSVRASLTYMERPASKPYTLAYDPAPGERQTNAVYADHEVTVEDARGVADELSLDVEGFELKRHRSSVQDWDDEALVASLGHAEAIRLVTEATGASRVQVFDHTIRKRAPNVADRTPGAPRQPAVRVHDDYTEWSGPQRVRDVLPREAEGLLARRFAFINVWRPINHPALEWPLAVCDERTIAPEDLIGLDLVYRERRGEIYAAAYNPAHRWFYFPDMQLDEALLIKCYDSRPDVARFVLHSAFEDPTSPIDAPWRESIEFRTIAFF
jgi:hypothetical protein